METIKMGPIGCSPLGKKTEWDEMGNYIISHIIVSYDTNGVRSIQFGYVNNGALAISKTYGSSTIGFSSRIVSLNHESEFVTGLSMEIFKDSITSLTFHTNQRKHEVVHLTFNSTYRGPQKVELHSEILDRREFGGFFGTYDMFKLKSIGFHVRLVVPRVKMIKEEKVRLNNESEFVTGISEDLYNGYISSLTFHTNQRIHKAVHLTYMRRKSLFQRCLNAVNLEVS